MLSVISTSVQVLFPFVNLIDRIIKRTPCFSSQNFIIQCNLFFSFFHYWQDFRAPPSHSARGGGQSHSYPAKGGAQPRSYTAKGGAQQEEPRGELEIKKEKGEYIGIEDEDNHPDAEDDGLEDIWKEMSMALECSKV